MVNPVVVGRVRDDKFGEVGGEALKLLRLCEGVGGFVQGVALCVRVLSWGHH